jgi:hypothetical protein
MKATNNDKPLQFEVGGKVHINNLIEGKDFLATKDYSRALVEFIEECDTPMTIGVQGDWGIGKTSMMSMIQAQIISSTNASNKKNFGVVWFNTWQFSLFGRDEYLGVAALSELLKILREQFEISESNDYWKSVKKLASSLSFSFMGVGIDGKKLSEQDDEGYEDISKVIKQFKEEFDKLIQYIIEQRSLDRIIFFIDDLDRVKPVKALELLESLKNFMDVENCVFILAVDYEVVQMGMRQKFGVDLQKQSGKSFFDKIIQLPFVMPSSSYDLVNYLKKLIEPIVAFNKLTDDDYSNLAEITTLTVGSNPRSIKRVINYISLITKMHKNSNNNQGSFPRHEATILYSVVCLQVAWPEIFNYFLVRPTPDRIRQIENWNHLDTIPFINKLYDRTPNKEELKAKISAYFDLFFEIVDIDGDGNITNDEFEPVFSVLKKCKYTRFDKFEEPLDKFISSVDSNKGPVEFLRTIFKRSQWNLSNDIDLKISGKRYSTLVYNRRQIGSLVTMKTEPLLFRIDFNSADLIRQMPEIDGADYHKIVYPLTDESKSGFGRTIIDFNQLSANSTESRETLDNLFVAMERVFQRIYPNG